MPLTGRARAPPARWSENPLSVVDLGGKASKLEAIQAKLSGGATQSSEAAPAGEEEVFDVESCQDKRTKNGKVEYLVRCKSIVPICVRVCVTSPVLCGEQGKDMAAMMTRGSPWNTLRTRRSP